MYKMVIVDDEPLMLEGFSKAVDWEKHGYQLIGAFRSPSGLPEFCSENKPDILLLDINMPEMDGITLLKSVKDMFPEMYVIMLTAHNEFGYVRDSLRYHADEYLWKPEISFQDILECLNRLTQKEKSEKSLMEEPDKKIYEFVDYEEEKCRFSVEIFQKITLDVERYLNLEDIQELENILNQMMEMILRDQPRKMNLLSSILHLVYLYREYFQKCEISQDEYVEEKDILNLFYQKNTYQEFTDGVFKLFSGLNQLLNEKKEKETDEFRRRVQGYVEENMGNTDLNLMQVSKAVGLSYSYCSRIFPELLGKNFSRYLIDLRMEKACDYLKYSKYKIDHILELVGYTDKSYFVKSFRQYTTMTPFRYREKYRLRGTKDEENKNS